MEVCQYRTLNILSALFSCFCKLPIVLCLVFQYKCAVKLVQIHFNALEQRTHFTVPFLNRSVPFHSSLFSDLFDVYICRLL